MARTAPAWLPRLPACLLPCLPNLLTLGNLAAGFAALMFTVQGRFEPAALAILAGGFLDGLDGRLARALGVASPIGKELDSLADLVSFGVAPALLLYVLDLQHAGLVGAAVALAFALCAGFRLARFSVGTPSGYFEGLPSLVAAGVVASLVLAGARLHAPSSVLLPLALAALMVSRLRYPDFKRLSFAQLRVSKVFLAVAAASAVALLHPAKLLVLPFAAYLLTGPKEHWRAHRTASRRATGAAGTAER